MRSLLLLGVSLCVMAGCTPKVASPTAPTAVDLTSPTLVSISATVGTGAAGAGSAVLSATVLNINRAPLTDFSVTFSTDAGTLTPTSAKTNAKGIADSALVGPVGTSVKVTAIAGTVTTSTLVALQAPPPPLPVPPPPPPPPAMAVGLSVTAGYAGQPSLFAATVSNATPPVSFVWQSGDGPSQTTSTSVLSHTYAAGTYQASVAITDAAGRHATAAQTLTIVAAPPVPLSVTLTCTAHILTIPTSCLATVTDNGIDITATMTGFDWTFGDGASALASTAAITHTYGAPGTYSVMVKANGTAGRTGTATASATVPSSLVGVLTVNCSTGIKLSVPPALSTCVVAATVGGTVMPSSSIGPVDWDWGDHTVTLAAPPNTATHNYASANTFTVVATATIAGTTGPATGSTTTTIAP